MSTLDKATSVWRQLKRVLSVGVFAGGAYLLWLASTGDVQGPVMLFIGALLAAMGVIGILFPSKVTVLNARGGVD